MNTQAIQIKKLQRVDVPTEYQKEEGCIAFQKVEITFGFYSAKRTQIYDTKILANGKQVVISGDGFIKDGFSIN